MSSVIPQLTCLLVSSLLATAPPFGAATDVAADIDHLTAEVRTIDSPGTPGSLALVTPDAFAVVLGGSGKQLHAPVVAASRFGKGRVVAFGHGGYLTASRLDSLTFMRNAVTWSAGPTDTPLSIGSHGLDSAKLERLREGQDWVVSGADLTALRDVDVLIMGTGRTMDPDMIRRVQRWVRAGGGLIIASTGWGWQQLNPTLRLAEDGPMNRLVAPMGIVWTNQTVRDTGDNAFTAEPFEPDLYNAAALLAALLEKDDVLASIPKARRRQIEHTLVQAVRSVDPDDGPLREPLRRFDRAERRAVVPTVDDPLRADDVRGRVALLMDLEALDRTEPRRVKAHPAADVFPGAVPARARRKTRSIIVDLTVPRWHSTGLYAAPGHLVTVVRESGPPIDGMGVRIGCHTDFIGGKDQWKRVPAIATRVPIVADETEIASAFGGLLYIEVPNNPKVPGTGPSRSASFIIRGAVPAPTWIHGTTTLEEWRDRERNQPAPWGELISDRVILSLPSEVLRDLDDPGAVMDVWTDVLAACAELAGSPPDRRRPERMVPDVQISAGYMHSGYPIMTHMDVKEAFVSPERLLEGQWGFYHELGHNHQSRDWTFGGTGEVTCNLFSLYVYDRVCGKGLDSDELHNGIVPARRREHIANHTGANADFATWKRKPFIALTMYVQLAEAFGWDAYIAVFAEYRDLSRDERPNSDQAKRDQWMVRFSRHVERDLSPFFADWGIPITDEARAAVADLQPWTPSPPES
jgi:hypothetical protein